MPAEIHGLHHVTAIAAGAQRNLDFYSKALGLRFVKRTVNFDDPGTYHLYYGNEAGTPGTIMTFFPWEHARRGRIGAGQVTLTQFAVPIGALDFWRERLPQRGGRLVADETVMGERRATFADPDELRLALVEAGDGRMPWTTDEIGEAVAIRGFHGVTLGLRSEPATTAILTDIFGYEHAGEERRDGGRLVRLRTPHASEAAIVDLHVDADMPVGADGAGIVHHVAFAVADRDAQREVRRRMVEAGLRVTEQIDRNYFWSVYSRTPGGVLLEVATDEPGFDVDEPRAHLGESLRLPPQHEPLRARLEAHLPPLSP